MATGAEQRARRWARAVQAAHDTVARLRADGTPALPMPYHSGATKLELEEIAEYRERRALHLERFPDYDTAWGRPEDHTAEAVWEIIAPNAASDNLTTKQALTVVLDCFVRAGRERRTVVLTHVFDALAARWSDWYRQAQRPYYAVRVRDMRLETAQACRRDLLHNGVNLKWLWSVAKNNQLYVVTRIVPRKKLRRKKKGQILGGYKVALRRSEALHRFEGLIREDQRYHSPADRKRLLLADEALSPVAERPLRQEVCGEQPYNAVLLGPRSERLLATLEGSRLLFHVAAFKSDYKRYKRIAWKVRRWKQRVPYERRQPFRRRLTAASRARRFLDAFSQGHVRALAARHVLAHDLLLIKAGYTRAINRRYHAVHFWPEHASGKLNLTTRIPVANGPLLSERASQRGRWFSFVSIAPAPLEPDEALAGYDISSSQTQILAILLGLDELEQLAGPTAGKKFKDTLAEQASRAHLEGRLPLKAGYENATQLVPLVKDVWTRVLYGGKLREIAWDHPELIVGTPSKEDYAAAVSEAAIRLGRFLDDLPWYGRPGDEKISDFFRACRHIAKVASRQDRVERI